MENYSHTAILWTTDLSTNLGQTSTLSSDSILDPIPDKDLAIFRRSFVIIWMPLCALGISTNIINIVTYAKIGVNDSVTICFFFLALSDLFVCSLHFSNSVATFIEFLGEVYDISFYIPPFAVSIYLSYTAKIFSYTTVSITVYLAVQRCLCVVLPFKVKQLFGRYRTYGFIAIIVTIVTVGTSLFISRYYAYEVTDLETNFTHIEVGILPGSEYYVDLFGVIGNVLFSSASPLLVLICLSILAIGLRKSMRFRKAAVDSDIGDVKKDKTVPKETQALIQVALLSTIFVLANVPHFGIGLSVVLIPGYKIQGTYNNLYVMTVSLGLTGEIVNSSVNFFIYYKYNSKFRNAFSSWVRRKQETALK